MTILSTSYEYNHLPQHQDHIDLSGLTIRKLLKTLRDIDFGNLGGVTIEMSDSSVIDVVLMKCSDGSYLMDSQYAERWRFDRNCGRIILAKYKLNLRG